MPKTIDIVNIIYKCIWIRADDVYSAG